MDSPATTVARPRKISMPPKVVTKPERDVGDPEAVPCADGQTDDDHQHDGEEPVQTPILHGQCADAPMKATTEPTDRSMWVAMMTISIPIAAMST